LNVKRLSSNLLFSYALVLIQFLTLGALLLTGSLFANGVGLVVQILGVLLGLWSLHTMHWGKFNITPDPRPDAMLVQVGPYAFIRHPMYLSIGLFFVPLVISEPTVERWVILMMLCVDLLIKLHYEEQLLRQKFEHYAHYSTKTHKLIPFVF